MKHVLIFLCFICHLVSQGLCEIVGDVVQIALPTTAFATTVYEEKGMDEFFYSGVSTALITHSLKYLVKRERPNKKNHRSFPSGHTSASFHGAAFLECKYGWKVGVPAYMLASYVGWSRVYAKKHYTSDVVAGALIAVGVTYYFTSKGINVSPAIEKVGNDYINTIAVSYTF